MAPKLGALLHCRNGTHSCLCFRLYGASKTCGCVWVFPRMSLLWNRTRASTSGLHTQAFRNTSHCLLRCSGHPHILHVLHPLGCSRIPQQEAAIICAGEVCCSQPPERVCGRVNLILLAGVDTTIFGVAMGAMTVVVYYTGYQFGWDTSQTSVFMSISSFSRVSALLIILPLLNYIVRTRRANKQRRESGFALAEPNSGSDSLDLATIRFAVMLEFIGYGGYAVARTDALFILSGILAACGGIGSPTLQSALTKHVPHDRVGNLLGATGLLHALARVVCPAIFNLIYAQTVGKFTQAVFVVLSGCFAVAFLFSWFIKPNSMYHLTTSVEQKLTPLQSTSWSSILQQPTWKGPQH